MAVVALTPTQIVANVAQVISQGAGTAIDPSNTNTIAYPQDGELIIIIDSDHANTAVTVEASDFAVGKGLGSKTFAVGNGLAHMVVLGGSNRFKKATGNIVLSYHGDSAGFLRLFYKPTVNAE